MEVLAAISSPAQDGVIEKILRAREKILRARTSGIPRGNGLGRFAAHQLRRRPLGTADTTIHQRPGPRQSILLTPKTRWIHRWERVAVDAVLRRAPCQVRRLHQGRLFAVSGIPRSSCG